MPLTDEDCKKFGECFEMFDEEGEGVIKVSELKKMMVLLGWDPTKSEMEELLRDAKIKGNWWPCEIFVACATYMNSESSLCMLKLTDSVA